MNILSKVSKLKVLLYLKKSNLDKQGKAPIMGRITLNRSNLFACQSKNSMTCHSEKEFKLNGTHAWLRIASDKDFYYMLASEDGTNFIELAKMEYRFLSTETIGGFTGVMLGLFTECREETKGYVDIDWFEYRYDD